MPNHAESSKLYTCILEDVVLSEIWVGYLSEVSARKHYDIPRAPPPVQSRSMWFILYIFLALPLLVVAYLELSVFRQKWILRKFKGPVGLPIVGNAHQMGRNPAEDTDKILEWWHEFGKGNYVFWIGTNNFLQVSDPKYIEVSLH